MNKNKNCRAVKSFSGCKTRRIVEEVKKLELPKRESCVIAHVGGNDLFLKGNKIGNSEPLVKELERLVDTVKDKTDRAMIVGILPRINVSFHAQSKAIGINDRIKDYCIRKNVKFLDPWFDFVGRKGYFGKDGIHLNVAGSRRLGDLLSSGSEELLRTKVNNCDQYPSQVDNEIIQLLEDNEIVETSFEGFSNEKENEARLEG